MQLSEEQLDDLWDECACEDGSIPFVSRRRFVEKVLEFRAQADARPVGEWESVRVKNFAPLMKALDRAEGKGYLPDAIAQEWEAFEFYTHPEASAPGLSERERYLIDKAAERLREADFIDEASAVRAILTRASAATVAEPSEIGPRGRPKITDLAEDGAFMRAHRAAEKEAAQQQAEPLGIKPEPLGAEFDKVLHDNLSSLYIEDGKQQAEPGADEQAMFLAAVINLADLPEEAHEKPFPDDDMNTFWAVWKAARAAQSGQRGAPEQILTERKLTCEAIEGAIAFGYQNTNPPPSDDHWLAPFWKIGRKQSELEQSGQRAGVAEDAIEAAAKKLAEDFDYPWEQMPAQGKDDFRAKVRSIAAMLTAATEAK